MPTTQKRLVLMATLGCVILASCAAPTSRPDARDSRSAHVDAAPHVERGLELVAHLDESALGDPWRPVPIEVEIVNRSTTAQVVVLPGDGSEVGWREPHVFFTAEVLADDGRWNAAPQPLRARCGLYDANWLHDVVRLAPGETRRLHWMGPLPQLPERGRARIRAHYVYKATPPKRAWDASESTPVPGGLGDMDGVAPFELISAPLEVTLSAP